MKTVASLAAIYSANIAIFVIVFRGVDLVVGIALSAIAYALGLVGAFVVAPRLPKRDDNQRF